LSRTRSFYHNKQKVIRQQIEALHRHYGISAIEDLDAASNLEVLDLKAAIIELRDSLKKLLWFWLVNFDKIFGALAKFQEGLVISDADLANRTDSVEALRQINRCLHRIHSENHFSGIDPAQTTLLERKYLGQSLVDSSLREAFAAIERDDAYGLDRHLSQSLVQMEVDGHKQQQILFDLLHSTVVYRSQGCTVGLIQAIESLQSFEDQVHWLIVKIGRSKKLRGQYTQLRKWIGDATQDIAVSEMADQLVQIFRKLGSKLVEAFKAKDAFARLPLHYAVQHDLPQVCQEILMRLGREDHSVPGHFQNPVLTPDSEGLTPLDLAVINGNVSVLEILIDDYHGRTDAAKIGNNLSNQQIALPGHLLAYAFQSKDFALVQLLCESVVDIQSRDQSGNTALHLAVRTREIRYVAEILQFQDEFSQLDLDVHEDSHGWTPLTLASARGDQAIAELLIQAGADLAAQDQFGWRAKDHAAFRGWLPLARKLTALTANCSKDEHSAGRLHQRRRPSGKTLQSVTSREHDQEALNGQSLIYVNLGALDSYEPITAVDMSPYVRPDIYNPQREADFRIEVRAINEGQARYALQLPILEDMANKPWLFLTDNPKDFKIAFNIYHSGTSGHEGNPLIGSAVALLDSLKEKLGHARESLIRNFTIPVLHKDTLDFIGTVTFYFQIVTPFPHPDPQRMVKQELSFPNKTGLPIIGHRGTLIPLWSRQATQLIVEQALVRMIRVAGSCRLEKTLSR